MATVSATLLAALKTWNASSAQARRDISLVVEIYDPDDSPPFSPVDALECFSDATLTFMGVAYTKELKKVGDIRRSITKDANTNSPSFTNIDNYIAAFALNFPGGLEGCHYVVRLLSRSLSTTLDDTLPLFTGRCERNIEGSREDFKLSAKQHLISVDEELPPRKLTADDPEGRAITDAENEAFPFVPERFVGPAFKVSERRGGVLGFFGFSKQVSRTLPVTSHTGLDPSKSLPLIGGRSKMLGIPIAFLDVGNSVIQTSAWCDGVSYGIQDIKDIKNASGGFTPIIDVLPQDLEFRYGYKASEGLAGRLQVLFTALDRPANFIPYSRTATSCSYVNGSALDVEDSSPDITATIVGAVVPLPDSTGSYLAKTGSITSGFATLTVSSVGYKNGDQLIIEGAATAGRRMYAHVLSGGGTTTLTLDANAGTTVAGASVRRIGFTDNPVHLSRWIITDPHLMGFSESFMDDAENVLSAAYCDQYLEDVANTDRVALPESENPATNGGVGAGVDYRRLMSTSRVTPQFFRYWYLGEIGQDPYDVETGYDYWDPLVGLPILTPVKNYRRRYTANFALVDSMKAVDFLFDVLFPCFRGYLIQGSNSKIAIKIKKPADHSYLTANVLAGATSVPVESVFAWINSLRGVTGTGAQLTTCEVRTITSATYSLAGNSITLAVTGALTASGATFAGGNGSTIPATATVTVTGPGALTITIDGEAVSYVTTGSDTTSSAAGMLAAAILANPVLNPYIKAEWNLSTGITLTAKMGSLHFTEPLEFAHDEGEEVLRGAMSFSGGASVQSDALRANMLKGSFGFTGTGSSGKGEYNQIRLKYRDASRDYQITEIRIPKPSEITGPVRPKEFTGTAIDNYHQAYRIAAGLHAEMVDSNLYTQHSSDGEALLIDEGEVIFSTHDAGGFVNLPVLVERVRISDDLKASFECKRYLTAMFSDIVEQRNVPLPTTLNWQNSPPPVPLNLTLDDIEINATTSTVRVEFDFDAFVAPQTGRVHLKKGAGAFIEVGTVEPDSAGHAVFDIPGLTPDTYQVKVQAFARGRLGTFTAPETIITVISGTIDIDILTVGTEIDFADEAARQASIANLGALSADQSFYGF